MDKYKSKFSEASIADELSDMVDENGLSSVLNHLSIICNQNANFAKKGDKDFPAGWDKKWEKMEQALNKLVTEARSGNL